LGLQTQQSGLRAIWMHFYGTTGLPPRQFRPMD